MRHYLNTIILLLLSWITLSNSLAVMSVDLGTEFVKIAIVKPGIPMEIALNKESRRKTPVIIAMKGKEREFGEAAVSKSMKIPQTSYMYLTDLVGKSIDAPVVEQFLKRFPYYKLNTDPYTQQIIFEHDKDTNYTVEELLSMILKTAKEYASDFAEQPVTSAVITIPPYFTQSERRSIKRACDLAQIKLLQLMNDNTAVALNYGVFRRKDFNETGSTYMFYDMGSQSTTATIVTYQTVKSKESGILETVPQLTVKGVGFDRNLGGLEFQIRIRDFLMKKFHEQHKNKYNLMENPRAMTKLFREAERAKQVLSANMEYTAQVEGLVDDIDFKHKISRDQFETMCSDLFQRVKLPVEEVLKTSGITLDEIQQVILFGGSTRIPKVQEELLKAVKQTELGKSINTDEAAAMGAVYQAAALSKGYRVKKFIVKDSNQYPINVQFERHATEELTETSTKLVDRTLFNRNNLYPQRKLMTFNRHIDDFDFTVHYGDLSYLSEQDKKTLGRTNLCKVNVKGAHDAYQKHKDTAESKGVKAHFRLDENCLLVLDTVEFVFEKKELVEEKTSDMDNEESTLSKLGNKISSFFAGKRSGSEDENEPSSSTTENETTSTSPVDENIVPPVVDNTTTVTLPTSSTKEEGNGTSEETAKDDVQQNSTVNATVANDTKLNETESSGAKNDTVRVPKLITIKEPLEFTIELLDSIDPTEAMIESSFKKLRELDANDRLLHELATAKNNLEAFIYDMKDKIENDQRYVTSTTEEDQEKIKTKLQEISDWLWEGDGLTGDAKSFKSKLDELKSLTRPVKLRVKEHEQFPLMLKDLKDTLNLTEHFLTSARTMTGEDQPFTDVEIKSLEKVIKETLAWRATVLAEQERTKPTDTPKYLSSDIEDKIVYLKREVSYLLNKAQRFVPKPKTTPKPPTSSTSKTSSDANKTNIDDTKPADEEQLRESMDETKPDVDDLEKLFEQKADTIKDDDNDDIQSERLPDDKKDIDTDEHPEL